MKPAFFFDRDGVINNLVWNPQTEEYESPHFVDDFQLVPNAVEALQILSTFERPMFIVSNQPSYAKGKTTLEQIKLIQKKMIFDLGHHGIRFTECFYSYRHPESIIEDFGSPCAGRKPDPLFALEAQKKYDLDMAHSFMIGDQDTDIQFGKAAGLKTISIMNPNSKLKRGLETPDLSCKTLLEAAHLLRDLLSARGPRDRDFD